MDAGMGFLAIVAQLNQDLDNHSAPSPAPVETEPVAEPPPAGETPKAKAKPDDENPTFRKPKLRDYKKEPYVRK